MSYTWKKHKHKQNVVHLEETSKLTKFCIPGKNIKTNKIFYTWKKHKNEQNFVYLKET